MKTNKLSPIFTLCYLSLYLSCASSPKYLTGYGTLDEQVTEAKRILDNARGFLVLEGGEEQLISTLSYFPPLFAEQPLAPSGIAQLSPYELEQKNIQYERDFKRWQDNNNRQIADAAKIRQASIKLLGQRPSLVAFEAISLMLFDSDPSVRNEAITVIKRSNPLVAKIIYERALSSELDESIRLILIQQLYSFGINGESYLIELLASDDETIATAAATALIQRYPRYPHPLLKDLVTSGNQASRYKSIHWLVLYQNKVALTDLLTIASNENDPLSAQRAQMLFSSYGRWVIDEILLFVIQERYPAMRLPMIEKIAQFTDDRGLPYLGELLASTDRDIYYRGVRYAKLYNLRFIATAVKLFNYPSAQVRLSAIQIISTYQDVTAVLGVLPLVIDQSLEVASAAAAYIEASVSYSEDILAKSFRSNNSSRLDYFIMKVLLQYGSPLLLYDHNGNLSFDRLYYLFSHIETSEWAVYVDKIKTSKRQIELQSLHTLYESVVNYNKLHDSYKDNLLVQEAYNISLASIINTQRRFDDNSRFDHHLSDSPPALIAASQANWRKEFAESLRRWSTLVKDSSSATKADFRDYTAINNTILSSYFAIKKEHQKNARDLLHQYDISINSIHAFISLNLRT